MAVVEFKRILCPVDLSAISVRPLAYAGAIAKWYGGRVTALHVVPSFEPMEVPAGAMFDPVHLVYPRPRQRIVDELHQTIAAAHLGTVDITADAEAGDPATAIVDQAVAVGADLIVMGTHGRSGFDRLLLGSVTEKVLRKAPCPVLTVPPHAPATPPATIALGRILCPIDFSPAALEAFGFALDIARHTGAAVTLLHVLELLAEEEPREYAHFNVPEFREYLLTDARARLERLVAGEPPVTGGVTTNVVAGRAHREILEIAQADGADLVVMGAQGRGGTALALFGSTTQQVVRGAHCAVLTVR